jgi:hypothetical protein
LIPIVVLCSLLMASILVPTIHNLTCEANPLLSERASVESAANRTVNITGQVFGTDKYYVIADFIAVAVNNATGVRVQSNPFNNGQFVISFKTPGFATENQTLWVQVLSIDEKTNYGNASLKLNDLSHTSSYSVLITIFNPPPNYNLLLLIILVFLFSLILASYILFTKYLVARAVMKRTREIMIERNPVVANPMLSDGSDEESDDEGADADEADEDDEPAEESKKSDY